MDFAEDYPNKPPVVKFVSPMFHPNSELSHACHVEILNSSCGRWLTCTIDLYPSSQCRIAVLQSMLMVASAWISCKTSGAPFMMWLRC
jgi:ubiquitin-protein ligase